uniref:Uncharacterized protein ycf56 n=1 Tax=Palmaria palmata TaxID=2822 RepID=A0A455TMR8_PALPL|nr:Uncharacterized protein ycf56 [Palmaria palmata]
MFNKSPSLLLKCSQTGIVWLFNCFEGCQHTLIKRNIKLHQINNIILTNLHLENMAGLMGLLSSLSLSSRIDKVNIYGPPGLTQYLQFARKYSQTTFKYNLLVRVVNYGYISIGPSYLIQVHRLDNRTEELVYNIIEKEKMGRFKSTKAQKFSIKSGPLYRNLKSHHSFICPDGNILSGIYFTHPYAIGLKLSYTTNANGTKILVALSSKAGQVIF